MKPSERIKARAEKIYGNQLWRNVTPDAETSRFEAILDFLDEKFPETLAKEGFAKNDFAIGGDCSNCSKELDENGNCRFCNPLAS